MNSDDWKLKKVPYLVTIIHIIPSCTVYKIWIQYEFDPNLCTLQDLVVHKKILSGTLMNEMVVLVMGMNCYALYIYVADHANTGKIPCSLVSWNINFQYLLIWLIILVIIFV